MKQPNILLIMSDQEQHWRLLPPALDRPGFERLLATGTGFLNHHVVTLPCGPSRSTIYAGQHTTHTRVFVNPSRRLGIGMSSDVPTIGSMLRSLGYYTAYKGKWHVSVIDPPSPFAANTVDALQDFGFAEYTPDGDPVGLAWDGYRRDPSIASEAAHWLLGSTGYKPADQPWFLAVNFVNPHDVMFFDATGRMNDVGGMAVPRLPAPLSAHYRREWDVELPESFDDDPATKPAEQVTLAKAAESGLGPIPHDDERAWRALRGYYFNCLRDLDVHVATVLDALTASGHDRDTVVVYTTDHGEAAGAHGYRDKPTSVYREVVNVPLVISHPDVHGGSATDALSCAVDIAPTVLALAGLSDEDRQEQFPQLTGHDLSAVVADATTRTARDERGVLFSTPDWSDRFVSLTGIYDGRWKLARYFAAGRAVRVDDLELSDAAGALELYDTVADPQEMRNLADDSMSMPVIKALAGRMASLHAAEVSATPAPGVSALS